MKIRHKPELSISWLSTMTRDEQRLENQRLAKDLMVAELARIENTVEEMLKGRLGPDAYKRLCDLRERLVLCRESYR
jgi:hypothetical protein